MAPDSVGWDDGDGGSDGGSDGVSDDGSGGGSGGSSLLQLTTASTAALHFNSPKGSPAAVLSPLLGCIRDGGRVLSAV